VCRVFCAPANHANEREQEVTKIIYKRESYAIIVACFEVHNEKGCGFLVRSKPSFRQVPLSDLFASIRVIRRLIP